MTNNTVPPRYLTSTEVARQLRYHPNSVIRRILAGDIPAIRVGGRYLVAEGDLAAFVKRSRVVPKLRVDERAHATADARLDAAGF